MSDIVLEQQLEKAKKRLDQIEGELVMKGYLNGWLIKSYEEEAKILKERIDLLEG